MSRMRVILALLVVLFSSVASNCYAACSFSKTWEGVSACPAVHYLLQAQEVSERTRTASVMCVITDAAQCVSLIKSQLKELSFDLPAIVEEGQARPLVASVPLLPYDSVRYTNAPQAPPQKPPMS